MDIDGPDAGAAAAGPLDEELAAVMAQLLLDEVDAKEAVAALETMAHRRAQSLRWGGGWGALMRS
jgi:hypothetical protein